MTAPSSQPDARTAREHAAWEPDQSLHGSHCGIQGPHSLGYGRQGQCDCGRDALLAQVERLEALVARSLNWEEHDKALRDRAEVAVARAETAERQLAEAREAIRELLDDVGITFADERLGYIEVQISPDALDKLRAALAATEPVPQQTEEGTA